MTSLVASPPPTLEPSRPARLRELHLVLLGVAALAGVAARGDAEEPWVLRFDDRFDRETAGKSWETVRGEAWIEDGRLVLSGSGARILCRRGFTADVRVEMEVSAWSERPPCDLSVTLCGNELDWGYLLAFGGNFNQLNQILGHGVRVVDRSPERLIEPGKTYRCVAQREGRRLSYSVDGEPLLEARLPADALGGPGFDRIGLMTWTGMVVDTVRVYERRLPHPETVVVGTRLTGLPLERDAGGRLLPADRDTEELLSPADRERLTEGLRLLNEGKPEAAAGCFRDLAPGLTALTALAHALGHLDHPDRDETRRELAEACSRLVAQNPGDSGARALAWASEEFRALRVLGGSRVSARRLIEAGDTRTNPFHDKARLYLARYTYWDGREGGDSRRIQLGLRIMRELLEKYPDHTVLREYTGDRIPWGEDLTRRPEAAPAWAADLREIYRRQLRVLRYWFERRQRPDGSLGGGWGDDVEILRTWAPVAAISTAAPDVVSGITRLADGVWDHVLLDGYTPEPGDVEHSAEPSADSLPHLLLLRHGDPLYLERNLRSARTIRERFLARDQRGSLRFRSTELGSRGGIPANPRAGGDTTYHVRAMKHFAWLAWYGNREARAVHADWVAGWGRATLEARHGKPAGVPPGSLWYPSGDIVSALGGDWWDPDLNMYGYPGPLFHLGDALTTAYALTGDRAHLEPFLRMIERVFSGPLLSRDAETPGSERWATAVLQNSWLPRCLSQYRALTGDPAHDEYLGTHDTPIQRFQIRGDLDALTARMGRTLDGLRVNFRLKTSEIIKTDRAALEGAALAFGAYTGAPRLWRDGGLPLAGVTWEAPDVDFAALVRLATTERLRARLYVFADRPVQMGLRFWRLRPGRYRLREGDLLERDGTGLERVAWDSTREIEVLHRGERATVETPAGRERVVDVRLVAEIDVAEDPPDAALAARDIEIDGARTSVAVTIHNIGAGPLHDLGVRAILEGDSGEEILGERVLRELAEPENFEPSTTRLVFPIPGPDARPEAGAVRIELDPGNEVFEISEENNVARCELRP